MQSSALASIGAGVGAVPLKPLGGVVVGGTTHVHAMYVVNTGTVMSRYKIAAKPIQRGNWRTIPAGWVVLPTTTLTLTPRQGAWVQVALKVPAGTQPGRYATNLVASTVASGSGARFGAAAAAKLTFDLPDRSGLRLPAWCAPLAAATVFALLGGLGVRRSGVRLRIERSPGRP
jgi:hypothetical protein